MSSVITHPIPAPVRSVPAPGPRTDGGARRPRWRGVVPGLVAGVLLLPSLVWIALDRSVWWWDQSWYGDVSVSLYYTLLHEPSRWFSAMTHAFGAKAPGIAWVGQFFVPLGLALRSIDFALRLSVLLTQFAALLLVWKLGREYMPGRTWLVPLAGCLLVASAPLFVGLSHQYLVEPMQGLAVAWLFYVAVASTRWPRLKTLSHLLAASSLALLAKVSTPPYCLLPGLMALFNLVRPRVRPADVPRRNPVRAGLEFAGGLSVFVMTALWYYYNARVVYTHAYLSSGGWVAELYGRHAGFWNKLSYWLGMTRVGLFIPNVFKLTAFLVTAGGASWLLRIWTRARRSLTAVDVLAAAALAQVAVILSVCSLSINEDPRFLLPLLPAVAVLVMWALAHLQSRAIVVAFLLVLAHQWGSVHAFTLGRTERTPETSCWLIPVDRDPTHAQEVERLVHATAGEERSAYRYNIIGVELRWLNFNTFNYYASQLRLQTRRLTYYTGLGYAEGDAGKAFARFKDFNSLFYITLEADHQPVPSDPFNRVARSVLERVSQDKDFVRVPFPSAHHVVVFERRPPR